MKQVKWEAIVLLSINERLAYILTKYKNKYWLLILYKKKIIKLKKQIKFLLKIKIK